MNRRQSLVALLAVLLLAGCGATKTLTRTSTIHRPAELAKPQASAEGGQAQPVATHYRPGTGQSATTPKYTAAGGCGVERWAVKTATDPAAAQINPSPQDATVADLASITPPINPTDRLAPVETTTYRLRATITAIKQEADSDYHLALADGAGNTMIAESPSASCDSGSLFAAQIAQVRSAIDAACPGIGGVYRNVSIPVDLTGVGFFDRLHGQRGVAPNGIELHPILSITLNGHCG